MARRRGVWRVASRPTRSQAAIRLSHAIWLRRMRRQSADVSGGATNEQFPFVFKFSQVGVEEIDDPEGCNARARWRKGAGMRKRKATLLLMVAVNLAGCCAARYRCYPCYPSCDVSPGVAYQSCGPCAVVPYTKCVQETVPTRSLTYQAIGRSKGEIQFSEFKPEIVQRISSVDEEFLLMEIRAAIPNDYYVDENAPRTIDGRRISLTVRKPEGQVEFLCRVIATVHPTASKVEFDISCGGNVDATPDKFNQVADDLKSRILANLAR